MTVFVGFKKEDIDLLGQQADEYGSGERISRLYCATCGSPIAYTDALLPGELYFYLGILDQQEKLAPRLHSWASEQLSWLHIDDHLPQYERFSRER